MLRVPELFVSAETGVQVLYISISDSYLLALQCDITQEFPPRFFLPVNANKTDLYGKPAFSWSVLCHL